MVSDAQAQRSIRLVIFGRQGAGKGTQAVELAKHYSIPHISTGDMLRAAVRDGTEFGLKAKEIMDRGELVSDDVMLGMVAERLSLPDAANGWILDGFPRTTQQAEDLRSLLGDAGIDLAIDLNGKLVPGMYLMTLQVNGERQTRRLVRQ